MGVPLSVEPFVESPPDRGNEAEWTARLLAAPLVRGAIGLGLFLVLWADAAREGLWNLPDPFQVFGGLGGYALAGAAGIVAGALVRTRRAQSPAPVTPRLPVFLRFDHRRAVIVGGGSVAASKIPALLAAGADVTVVAPSVSGAIDRTQVRVEERAFVEDDLDGAWFVTAAATPSVNRIVREAADRRAIFVNAVDDPANATAYLGGTIARGGVTVAISTSGDAPALAGLLREAFDELVPPDIETWVERARVLRQHQRAAGVPMADRRRQLLDALNRLYERRDHRASEVPSFAKPSALATVPADRLEGW